MSDAQSNRIFRGVSFKGVLPRIHESAFIAPSADIIGDVEIGEDSSVWFQVVIRGDVNPIRIGSRTNIQDGCVLHVTRDKPPMISAKLVLGNEVSVAHRVTLHGCTIRDRVLIGMGATILDHAEIGEDSMVAAGALVTKGKQFPPGSLIQGVPAKAVRALTEEEKAIIRATAQNYVNDRGLYKKEHPRS